MKQLALPLFVFLTLSTSAQLHSPGISVGHSTAPHSHVGMAPATKHQSSPNSCTPDTLQYAYYKGFGGTTYNVLSVSDGYAVGQYFDAPEEVSIYGVSIYAFGLFNTDDSVQLTVNLYEAGNDTLPYGSPIRSATIWIDSINSSTISVNQVREHLSFGSAYLCDHPFIITIESVDTLRVGVVSTHWQSAQGEGENIACATVGGTWYNCMNLNVAGATLDCDFLIEPHVNYEIYGDFSFEDCYTNTDSVEFVNESSPLIDHRMYNRLYHYDQLQYSFFWNFGDGSGALYDQQPKHLYTNPVNTTVRQISRLYPYSFYSNCSDTAEYQIYYEPTMPLFKADTPVCSGNSATITTSSTGSIEWFKTYIDSTVLGTGTIFYTDTLYSNYLIHADGVNQHCRSTRNGILVPVALSPSDPLVTHDSICLNAKANLTAYANAGTVMWWDDSIAGIPVFIGNVFQTDTLTSSLMLYAQSNNRGCLSPNRIPVRANVNASNAPDEPLIPGDTNVCLHDAPFWLSASNGSMDDIHWYNQASGGSPILISDSIEFEPQTEGVTTLYVEAYDGQCASSRLSIDISIESFPDKMIGSQDTLCLGDTAFFDYSATPGSVRWFDSIVSGNLIYDGDIIALSGLSSSTIFYLEPYLNACRDTIRHAVVIDVAPFGAVSNIAVDEICADERAVLSAESDAGNIIWSLNSQMDSILHLGDTMITAVLTQSGIYYLASLNYKCQSDPVPVNVTVNPKPNPGFNFQVNSPGNFRFVAVASNVGYAWDFDDGASSSAKVVDHKYTDNGIYEVMLITTSSKGCSDTSTRTITVSGLVGLDDLVMDQSDLIVFPNPTSGQFIVLNAAGYQELQIRNAQGQVLQSADLIIGENTVQLDFPFSDGIYYLYLQSETGIRTIKLLVTK